MEVFLHPLAKKVDALLSEIDGLSFEEKVQTLNEIRLVLKKYSPFSHEPVDCVLWAENKKIFANTYNPNNVAPPEMKLLELSIREDGYTQPIVTWFREDGTHEVVDGFHRNQVGRKNGRISKRLKGYLPVVAVNPGREKTADRMASTIRHNRARGKHQVDIMAHLIFELKRINKSDIWIAEHLGMDPDEILRLSQISSLIDMFSDGEFSKAWDIDFEYDESEDVYPSGKTSR